MDCGDESGERVEMGVGVLRGGEVGRELVSEVGRELVSGVEGREAGEGDGDGLAPIESGLGDGLGLGEGEGDGEAVAVTAIWTELDDSSERFPLSV